MSGDASKKSTDSSMAAACHISRATATAKVFSSVFLFSIIECIIRQFVSDCGGVVVIKDL